jgi:ABC-type sulfate transport system permease component
VAALKLSVIWAARRWSAMLGTITAWVLVRDRFPGGRS